MKKGLRRVIALVIIAVIMISTAVSAYAVTGTISATDHSLVLNALANYNTIQCSRSLTVTTSAVTGNNTITWYTYTGNATQLAYCNAITGTSKVTINGNDGNNVNIGPVTKTVNFLGQNLSSVIPCTARKLHNLNLVYASAVITVTVYTPDGALMTTYYKTMSMS